MYAPKMKSASESDRLSRNRRTEDFMFSAGSRGAFLLPESGCSRGEPAGFKCATINENARLKFNVSFSNAYISETESKTYKSL